MLEKYLSAILVPYFSQYAENIDAKQLKVDIWSGKASLNDLVLKPSLLDALLQGDADSNAPTASASTSSPPTPTTTGGCLPLTLQRGICKQVNIVVPFTQLRSKPVVVEVDELFICLRGNTESREAVLSKAAKLDAQAAHKARELEQFEAERRRLRDAAATAAAREGVATTASFSGAAGSAASSSNVASFGADAGEGAASLASPGAPAAAGAKGGYFSRLGELVVNNIVVKVRSVHVRYEDESTRTVMGVVLGGVQLLTVDGATGEAKFVDPAGLSRTCKRLEFTGMQFYCDDPLRYDLAPQDYFISNKADLTVWHAAMRGRVEAGEVARSTLLGPVMGRVDVNLVFKQFIKDLLRDPYVTARMKLEAVTAKFNRAQYVSLMRTVSLLSNWTEVVELFPRRPAVPVRGHAAVWWRYAIRAVQAIAGAPRRERLLQRVSELCVADYHVLYRDVVRKAEMSADKQRAYRFITRFMTVPDMIAGRKYVYAQLANAIQLKRKDNEAKKAEAQSKFAKESTGWFGWMRRGPKTPQDVEEEELAFEELERSYGIGPNDAEGAEATAVEALALPKSYCWLDAQFELPMFVLQLGLEKVGDVTLRLHSVETQLKKFNAANSVQLRFITENLTLSNPLQDTAFLARLPELVEGVPLPPTPAVPEAGAKADSGPRSAASLPATYSPKPQGVPLLECSVAFNPLEVQRQEQPEDTHLDFALDLRLLPLRIVADPSIIDNITRFFQVPRGLELTSLVQSTKSLAATVGQTASSELREAMAHSKSFSISVDAAAPYIIVPRTLRGSVEEPALAVSLGHVKFETQPLTETEKQQRLATTTLDDVNEELMYYSSSATFSNFYVELAPIGMSLERPGTGFMLLPEVAFTAKVLQRIGDATDNRERFIVRMEVPVLCVACSVSQAHVLSSMVESWMLYLQASDSPYADEQLAAPPPPATLTGGENPPLTLTALDATYSLAHAAGTLRRARLGGEAEGDDTPPSLSQLGKPVEDLPYVRLHLWIKQLGILLYEDEPATQRPMRRPRFTMAFSAAEVTLHMRTVQKRVSVILEQPYCRDAKKPDELILSAAVIRCGVETSPDAPVRVKVELEPSLRFRFGTPCIQLLETLMDIVNLLATAPSVLPAGETNCSSPHALRDVAGGGLPPGHAAIRGASEQAQQLSLVEELHSTQDAQVAHLSLHIAGTAVVEFMDRRKKRAARRRGAGAAAGKGEATTGEAGDVADDDDDEEEEEEDCPFAHACFSEVTLSLKQNRETMEVSGGVEKMSFALSEAHDIAASHRTILQYKPPEARSPIPAMLPPQQEQEQQHDEGAAADTHPARQESHQHINFAYRTSLPVVPIFETDGKGKRYLVNAAELRFSSFVEIEVGSSTLLLDACSLMTVMQYFSAGPFARVTKLGSRPRYDGRVVVAAPAVKPPTLLTSVRVFTRDLDFILPIDAHTTSNEHFQLSVDHVVVQSSLLSAEGRQSMDISLRAIRLLHAPPDEAAAAAASNAGGAQEEPHTLMPTATLDMSVKAPLDPLSDEPLYVDLRGEDVTLQITEANIVQLCRLASGNLARASPPSSTAASASLLPPQMPSSQLSLSSPPLSTSHMMQRGPEAFLVAAASVSTLPPLPLPPPPPPPPPPVPPAHVAKENIGREVHVVWRASKVCLDLLDTPSNQVRFHVEGNALVFRLFAPGNDVTLRWKSLELHDVFEETHRAPMLLCGESNVEMRNILTSCDILQKNFGMRSSVTINAERSTWELLSSGVSGTEDATAENPVELLEVPTLVVDFTLKRFAVSDQWLAVHDFVCNEAVMNALQPVTMRATQWEKEFSSPSTSPVAGDAVEAANAPAAGGCFHCLVRTRAVNVPFLTTSREEFIEAEITSLFVDVLSLASTTKVAVRMQDLAVSHAASAERILYRQTDVAGLGALQDEFVRSSNDGVPLAAPAPPGPADAEAAEGGGGDILSLSGTFDAEAARQKVTVAIGQLTVLCSMPLLVPLVEYCTRPDQPIAKISNLGVMRERREWLARAAQQMVQNGALSLYLLWRQPRIILAGDAQDLANRSRSIEAQLGVMRSTVQLDKRSGSCTVAMKVTEVAIPDMLEKSSLQLSYALKDGREEVSVVLDKTTALLHREELEKLLWVLQRNLLAPVPTRSDAAPPPPPPPGEEVKFEGGAPHAEVAPVRTIQFHAEGVVLAIHDVVGINAHTATLSGIHVEVAPCGEVRLTVDAFTMLEHFTNRHLAESLGDKTLTVRLSSAEKATHVALPDMKLTLIPKALGSLLNTVLSVQFPPPLQDANAGGELCLPSEGGAAAAGAAAASTTLASRVLVSLNHCSAVAVLGGRDVCVAELKDSAVEWEAHVDTSTRLTASIGWAVVRDLFSAHTLYPELLRPLLEGATGAGEPAAAPSRVMEFAFTSAPQNDVEGREAVPSYARQMRCEIFSLALVLVPEVASALLQLLSDVKEHISDVNREKAYDYVADKTAQTVQQRQELTQVELQLHSPSVTFVDAASSAKTMVLFPGDLRIWNEICRLHAEDAAPQSESYAEVFRLNIQRMSFNVLEAPTFAHKAALEVSVTRGIGTAAPAAQAAALPASDTTSVVVAFPTLVAHVTQEQLDHLMDFMAAMKYSSPSGGVPAEHAPRPPASALQAAGGGCPECVSGAPGGATPASASLPPTVPGKKKPTPAALAPQQLGNAVTASPASADTVTSTTSAVESGDSLSVKAHMRRLEVDIGGVFQLGMEDLEAAYATNPAGNATTTATAALGKFELRHRARGASASDAFLQLLMMRRAQVTSTVLVQTTSAARVSETNTDVTLDCLQLSLAPVTLVDTREMLYGPFCTKVLRAPLLPIPVCRLTTDVHVLDADLVLDGYHILNTADKTRGSYTLDLNQHKLFLSSPPSAQIALDDHCQLTITNGSVVVPGMYTVSSFVSFGFNASLLTTDSCVVEKRPYCERAPAQGLKPTSRRRSKGTTDPHGGKNTVSSPLAPSRPPSQSGPLSPMSAAPILAQHAAPVPIPAQAVMGDEVRTIVSLQCKELGIQMVSEEVEELTLTLNMAASLLYSQKTENGVLMQRSGNMRLKDVRTSAEQETTLLPTNMVVSVAGADTVCVAVSLSGLEMCLRMALLRSLVEFGKDSMIVLLGEPAVQRRPPQVELEDEELRPLVALPAAGECRYCGGTRACLGASTDAAGVFCYRCCTGRQALPATEMNFEVQLVDLLFLGSDGGMLQLRAVNGLRLVVASDLDFHLQVKLQMFNLNHHAAVWEPLVERLEGNLSGNLASSTYKIRLDHVDYVFSPHNMKLLLQLAADFSPNSALQKQLGKKFRKIAEEAPSQGPADVALASVRGAITSAPALGSPSSNHVYALVVVVNHFTESLEVDGGTVGPCGGKLEFQTTSRNVFLRRTGAGARSGVTINCAKSPLCVRGNEMLVEVRVELSRREQSFRLHRVVHLQCFPVHHSNVILCFENNSSTNVEVTGGMPTLRPQERLYFQPNFSLDEKLCLRPVRTFDGEEYAAAVTTQSGVTPTLRMLLGGFAVTLVCQGSKKPSKHFLFRMREEQGGVHAGIPTFIVSIEPQLCIYNCLPYDVFFTIGGTGSRKKEVIYCAVVGTTQKLEVGLGEVGLDEVVITLELQQLSQVAGDAAVTYRTQRGISCARGLTPVRLTTGPSKEAKEMRITVQCVEATILLGTPYSLVNFTPLELQVAESKSSGGLVSRAVTNFAVLPKQMKSAYAAAPSISDANAFFVNVRMGQMLASGVPLHVQGRGLITLMDTAAATSRGGSCSVYHLVYLTEVDMYGTCFVTIVPRWVVINRTPQPLYIAQALKKPRLRAASTTTATPVGGGSSGSARAAARTSTTPSSADAAPPSGGSLFVCNRDMMQLAPANAATPFFSTLYSTPDVGYDAFVLQNASAPVRGDPVSLEELKSTLVVVHGLGDAHDKAGADIMLEVSVNTQGPYTYVTLQHPVVPPYLLINRTSRPLELYDTQRRLLAQVKPGCMQSFVLDVQDGESRTRVCFATAPADATSSSSPTAAKAGAETTVQEGDKATGQTPTFVEFNFQRSMTPQEAANPLGIEYRVSLGPFAQQILEIVQTAAAAEAAAAGAERALHTYQPLPPSPLDVVMNLGRLTVSLVMMDRDLLFGSIVDTRVHFNRQGTKELLDFSIKNYQLDNQSEAKPIFEVVAAAIRSSPETHAISGHVERTLVPAKAFLHVDEVRLDVVPVALRFSDNVLVALAGFAAQLGTETPPRHTSPTEEELFDMAPLSVGVMNTRVILERMVVNPLVVRLWFEREVDGHDFIREHMQIRTAALVSMLVRSCEDVRVAMPGIAVQKRSSSADLMLKWMLQIYVDGVREEIRGLLLQYASSLPLLGVPIKLVSGIGSGAMKFFQEPIAGLSTSPKAFAMGFASGSSALVSEVMGGGLGAVSNLAKTGADLMGAATGGRQRRRTGLLEGIASGVTGVVTRPMEGAAESGTTGLVRGVGMGLLGVVAHPVAGLLSDVSKLTGAAAQLCDDSYIPDLRRVRRLRDFHAMGAVAEYDSLLSLFEYERGEPNGLRWKGVSFLPTDGPPWYPCTKEEAQCTAHVAADVWRLALYDTSFEGWRFCPRYYGLYTREKVPTARVRRRRWVAVLRPPPTSRVVRLVQQVSPTVASSARGSSAGAENNQRGEATANPTPRSSLTPSAAAAAAAATVAPPPAQRPSASGAAAPHDAPRSEQVVEVYEYESKVPILGWGRRFLPAGCPPWQYRDGRAAPRKSEFQLHPGWAWASAWTVASSAGSDGWEYVKAEKNSSSPTLRRRCWRRTARRVQ
ncbi:uncharacterized protein Tco025E_06213 [Trypanosoma conorhini]|uniref:Vacuolar protein sorting-associated protein 13 family protein n=1 Tax=Trypanosoma conorhini TaxID=83891 RepID=A0A422P6I7_9TRYP|nr:uncharacterized protein Tco025E_06213 [Trypanosoma conorhini]RNF13337.1 hypothetical protein Tco025E_06213 [Trypanosoma conorhini]